MLGREKQNGLHIILPLQTAPRAMNTKNSRVLGGHIRVPDSKTGLGAEISRLRKRSKGRQRTGVEAAQGMQPPATQALGKAW